MQDEPARLRSRWELVVLAAAFVLVNLAAAWLQKPISYHDGKGWEGVNYYAVAEQFGDGRRSVEADAPEVYRVGAPWLAGLVHRTTGLGILASFKVVNGVANALTLAGLAAWLRRFVADWRVRTALGLAFVLQWDTPTRWMYFFPAHTDPWMWTFLLAGLLALEGYRRQPTVLRLAGLAALVAVGVCFREVMLVVACAAPFVGNPLPTAGWRATATGETLRCALWPAMLPRLVPLVAGVAALALVRRFVAYQQNNYSFTLTAAHWLYDKPWVTYVHGWFLAYGPGLWLAVFDARRAGRFLATHQHLAVYALAVAVLGDIGGTDTERLLFWSMPVVYVLVGRSLERYVPVLGAGALATLAGAQLLASRAVFWPIPDYPADLPHVWPLFTPLGRHVPFLDLYGFWELRLFALTSLLTFLAFGAVLGVWLAWRNERMIAVAQKKILSA